MPHDLTILDAIHAGTLTDYAEVQQREQDAADGFASASRAASTREAYRQDWAAFLQWCTERGCTPLPATPDIVAQHLASRALGDWHPLPAAPGLRKDGQPKRTWIRPAKLGLSPSSVARVAAAIAYFHRQAGLEPPTQAQKVRDVLAGIRRSYLEPSKRKAAATGDVIRLMINTCGQDMQGLRDRALLALGFAGALRRSELVALNVEDLREVKLGYELTIRRSKVDQEGQGATIAIGHGSRLRPVDAVQAWLEAAGITSGAIFVQVHRHGAVKPVRLTAGMVALIVKRRARLANIDPQDLSAHSLRAGFITSAAENGANVFRIMDISRHRSLDVLRGYVRSREMWRDYAGAGIV